MLSLGLCTSCTYNKITFTCRICLRCCHHVENNEDYQHNEQKQRSQSEEFWNIHSCIIQEPVGQSVILPCQLYSLWFQMSIWLLPLQTWTPQWKGIRLRLTFAATSMRAIFARANMLVLCNIQSNLSPFSPLLSIAFPQQPLRSSITEHKKKN